MPVWCQSEDGRGRWKLPAAGFMFLTSVYSEGVPLSLLSGAAFLKTKTGLVTGHACTHALWVLYLGEEKHHLAKRHLFASFERRLAPTPPTAYGRDVGSFIPVTSWKSWHLQNQITSRHHYRLASPLWKMANEVSLPSWVRGFSTWLPLVSHSLIGRCFCGWLSQPVISQVPICVNESLLV